MYHLVDELCGDLSDLLQKAISPMRGDFQIAGNWTSVLFRQPDRPDGTFAFEDSMATRIAYGGLLYQCIYTIPEPGILRLCESHEDAIGNWMSHPSREIFFAYRLDEDTIALSNEDTSVVRILSRI